MFNARSAHFLKKVLRSRPTELPDIVLRRGYEALTRAPKGVATSYFGDVRYDVDMSLHAIARKYHFHTHEMFLERIFREHLGPGAVFVDVGANMAYWSAFAASLVGPRGEVHAFEPAPHLHACVERLAAANPRRRILANKLALGAEPGFCVMNAVEPTPGNYENFDTNIGSNSLLPGFLDHERDLTRQIVVEVTTLDAYVDRAGLDLDRVGLIKIDVEGYEWFALEGMKRVLDRPGVKIPILCELLTDPARSEFLDARRVIARMASKGYAALDAATLKPFDPRRMRFEENVLFV